MGRIGAVEYDPPRTLHPVIPGSSRVEETMRAGGAIRTRRPPVWLRAGGAAIVVISLFALLPAGTLAAPNTILADDFESGAFSPAWASVATGGQGMAVVQQAVVDHGADA